MNNPGLASGKTPVVSQRENLAVTDQVKSKQSAAVVTWLLPCIVALATMAAFFPALHNNFVNWDDDWMLLENPNYRGLGWTQLRWMFSSFHAGHYQPLSWITFGLDYVFWGMDPFGYHLTNLVLHAANAVCFYFIARRLLALAVPVSGGRQSLALYWAALFAALVFSLHPLRVESVAWATERRDVLSGFFYLLTILLYLKAVADTEERSQRRRWMALTVVAYLFSLLSKASGMTVPLVLLILDVYPLRRLGNGFKEWFDREKRQVWLEKLPFVFIAVIAGIVALIAQQETKALAHIEAYGVGQRTAQALYGLVFYLWKSIWPVGLSPLYAIPIQFDPLSGRYVLSGIIVITLTVCLFLARQRWPAGLASWVYYLAVVAPVLGFAQSGAQFVADRYSYLPCLGWALLVGSSLIYLGRHGSSLARYRRLLVIVSGLSAVLLVSLGVLTWRETEVWRDSERLWRHAIAVRPSSGAYNNLGTALLSQGRLGEASEQFHRALAISPTYEDAYYNLGLVLVKRGDLEAAIQSFRQALNIDPADARAHNNLAIVLIKRGELGAAIDHFRRVVELNPSDARAYNNLGSSLAQQGRPDEAVQYFRRAVELNPDDAGSRSNLARALLDEGDIDAALQHLRRALELNPKDAELHSALAMILARRGELEDASEHFKRALELAPADARIQSNLAVTLAKSGDLNGAVTHFEEALRIDPNFAQAHGGLAQALAIQGRRDEAMRHYQEAMRLLESQNEAPATR
jgi:protein O-mannosyl-transferase